MSPHPSRWIKIVAALLAASGAAAQSGLQPEVLLLARIRAQARQDLAQLPSFTCLETINRFSRNKGTSEWSPIDTVRVEVAHVVDKELFAWPGSSHFEDRPLSEIVGTGMSSSGEFTSFARGALLSSAAAARYSGDEVLNGQRAARYDYDISPAFSGLTVSGGGASATAGQHGTFWAGVESHELLRLAVQAVDIPEEVPVKSVGTEIDYQRVQLGDGSYLLPRRAVTTMRQVWGPQLRNEIEFTACRQFSAESVLSFDDAELQPSAGAGRIPTREPAAHAREAHLPGGLVIPLRLETPIDSARSKVGDEVVAFVAADVTRQGVVLVAKGARLTGRLQMLHKEKDRSVVGLEFTELTSGEMHARFSANLLSVDTRYARLELQSVERHEIPNADGYYDRVTTVRTVQPAKLPGVGSLFVPSTEFTLPRGMKMEWITVELGTAK